MNKELFASMQRQMSPSPAARAALEEALAGAGGAKRRVPARRYAALAACALALAVIWPFCRLYQDHKWQIVLQNFQENVIVKVTPTRHSYEIVDNRAGNSAGVGTDSGAVDDLSAPMAAEEYAGEYAGEPVNTGDLPTASDIPSQEEAVSAYQNLMARFDTVYGPDAYPEWYGGAYIDGNGGLVVNIVETYEPEDKSLFFQIWEWAGSSQVGFGSARYSLADLRDLQDRAFSAMAGLGLAVGCGVNEEAGQVELNLSEATDEALRLLAELDPADDAIRVRVGRAAGTDLAEDPIQPGSTARMG